MGRLDGKVALISGGSRGMGATEVKLFSQEGAKVVFGDILDEEGYKVESDVRASGGEVTYVHLDVTREVDWHTALETTLSSYGKLDILVNNAGITIHNSVSNQQKWDTLGAERSGAGWRSGELPEGPVVESSPFGGLSLHLLPAL